jgi:hypothetical protein
VRLVINPSPPRLSDAGGQELSEHWSLTSEFLAQLWRGRKALFN